MLSDDLTPIARTAWEQALEMPVSQDTDFFDAGGHSFVAIRIATRLEESLGAAVPARLVFDHPVFADYVAALSAVAPSSAAAG
jgi:hypothetical protein